MPGTLLNLLECLHCTTPIGLVRDGVFKQLETPSVKGKGPKAGSQWDKTGLPVGGEPWVGCTEASAAPSITLVLVLKSTGGSRKQIANPRGLKFDMGLHMKAALGSRLVHLDEFKSKSHTSSEAVIVIDSQGQFSLRFPLSKPPKFRYELPPNDVRTTCGQKRAAQTTDGHSAQSQRPRKVLKSLAKRDGAGGTAGAGVDDDDEEPRSLCLPLSAQPKFRHELPPMGVAKGRLVAREKNAEMEVDFDANTAFAQMGEGDMSMLGRWSDHRCVDDEADHRCVDDVITLLQRHHLQDGHNAMDEDADVDSTTLASYSNSPGGTGDAGGAASGDKSLSPSLPLSLSFALSLTRPPPLYIFSRRGLNLSFEISAFPLVCAAQVSTRTPGSSRFSWRDWRRRRRGIRR